MTPDQVYRAAQRLHELAALGATDPNESLAHATLAGFAEGMLGQYLTYSEAIRRHEAGEGQDIDQGDDPGDDIDEEGDR